MAQNKYAAMTNRELLAECLETIAVEAWQEFVRRFEPIIASSVARIARQFDRFSVDLILDLTQDVYFKLCRDGFRLLRDLRITHEKALFAYLKLVAMSVAYDHFRKKRADLDAEEFCDDSAKLAVHGEAASATAEEKILVQEVEEIVERITTGPNAERDRLVFWLHHREGLSGSEIAAIPVLKLTQKGVESVLHRIKVSLRNELKRSRKGKQSGQRLKPDFSVS